VRTLLLAVCVLTCVMAHAQEQVCGPHPKRFRVTVDVIALDSGSHKRAAFYVRVDQKIVFLMPDDVLEAVRSNASFSAAISADLPLLKDTDLYKYSLRDESFERLPAVVMGVLLQQGHASIADWRHIVDEHHPQLADEEFILRSSLQDHEGRNIQLTVCAADGTILVVPYYEMQ